MESFFFVPISAITAEIISIPIDAIKTNKQVYSCSTFNIIKNIYYKEGLLGFYKSFPPACGRHMIYTSLRVNLYEKTRNKDDHIIKKIISASSVSAFAQFCASPNDYLKIRLQTKRNYRLKDCIKDIYKKKGLLGFWSGWQPNVARAAIVSAGTLVSYDAGKNFYKKKLENKNLIQLFSSITSGVIAGFLSSPTDVVKSLVMSEKYKNISSCVNFFKKEGIFSLWRGFPYQTYRITVWQIMFWSTFENIRTFFGYEEFS